MDALTRRNERRLVGAQQNDCHTTQSLSPSKVSTKASVSSSRRSRQCSLAIRSSVETEEELLKILNKIPHSHNFRYVLVD